jgi:long-chain acyl-CoA synthetase
LIDVGETFRQHEILLTGTSGFLGKVVMGLLIDRYPDFKHLHVLIRPARDVDARERFQRDVLGSPALKWIVERANEREPLERKLSVLPGDIALPSLGLNDEALERLARAKLLVINCAGRVDFFPPLDDSLHSNVDGVESVLEVSRRLKASLLHVSTCFVCGESDGLIEETDPILGFYPHRKGPDDVSFDVAEELRLCRERVAALYRASGANGNLASGVARRPRELAQRLTALGRQRAEHWGWVNTYTYSKSLGEQVLASEKGVQWTIVRPAIIESALEFPFPGWIEGGRTAAPLVLMALGGMKKWPMRRDAALEVVPVDQVAAAILVAGALLLRGQHQPVYQLASADVNPIHLEPLVRLLHAETRRLASSGVFLPAAGKPQSPSLVRRWASAGANRGQVRFLTAAQARARRARQEHRIEKLQNYIGRTRNMLKTLGLPGHHMLQGWSSALRTLGLQARFREQTFEHYLPFVLHNRFVFECENIREGYGLISPEDRRLLPWSPEKIDWKHYWTHNQVTGIQKWIQPEAVKGWSFRL